MKNFLFAYGTLQSGFAPPEVRGLMKYLNPVGKALAKGKLLDLGEYPGAIFEDDAPTAVQGTVYSLPASPKVTRDVLQKLDEYEGVNFNDPSASLFVRKKMPLALRSGQRLDCWVYEYAGDRRMPSLSNGTFPKPRTRRRSSR
jgi:gamma-glutamylcyclotransferase (GGCT)/AIG2-like uncharacterized protein YtfP